MSKPCGRERRLCRVKAVQTRAKALSCQSRANDRTGTKALSGQSRADLRTRAKALSGQSRADESEGFVWSKPCRRADRPEGRG